MKRRAFLQCGSLAGLGVLAAPTLLASTKTGIIENSGIKKVHLVFKTHLDVGFTNFAAKVIQIYMEQFIPGALNLAENLRNTNPDNRFVWTTGSWLIYEYLEKADPSMRKRMEKAIELDDIVWHGLPFTMHSELVDPSLYDLGIQLLHIGVNPASMPPDVPPLCVWRAPDGSEVVLMYQKEYGSQMLIPGTQTVVAICFTNDNHGPHKPEEIVKIYDDLRKQYPIAHIEASSLNAIAAEISSIRDQLPVITQELGDTWIHGPGSDPLKISRYRELSRLRKSWIKDKTMQFGDATDLAFGIPLLMVAEHTWGLDVKKYLGDYNLYAPEAFKLARLKPNFKRMEESWQEKREYINTAVAQLSPDKAKEARKILGSLKPVPPNQFSFTKLENHKMVFDTPFYELKIDPITGGIIRLKDKTSGIDWAGEHNPLCLFSYQTFAKPDFDKFQNEYLTNRFPWAIQDFGKEGIESANPQSKTWMPTLKNAFLKKDLAGETIMLELAVTDTSGKTIGGSPEKITVELFLPSAQKELQVMLQWFGKLAYRLPEASWFSFIPPVQKGEWILDKMGRSVNYRDVIKNGNRKLHAIIDDIRFEDGPQKCSIQSLDAPLAAPGERTLLNFDNRLPEAKEGIHFCLHNNVWGTNFMMWFEDDMKYRFVFKT